MEINDTPLFYNNLHPQPPPTYPAIMWIIVSVRGNLDRKKIAENLDFAENSYFLEVQKQVFPGVNSQENTHQRALLQ